MITGLFLSPVVLSYADWNDHDHSHSSSHGHDSDHSGDHHRDSDRHHDNDHGHGGSWHRDRAYVGINFYTWPDTYYYAPPYYAPMDQTMIAPPVYEPVAAPADIDNSGYIGAQDIPDSITVNIPDKTGGYTAVTLKRSGTGFIGPQGEFYPVFPKVSELEIIYGK